MYRFLVILALSTTTLHYSFTKEAKRKATVIRDCSGTYLRIGKADYLVCNREILDSYTDGSKVSVRFRKNPDCPPRDEIVCMLYHENKGVIEVTKVE